MEATHLDRVDREKKAMMLSNHISSYMIEEEMTLENLEDAIEKVKEVYHRNAIMKG